MRAPLSLLPLSTRRPAPDLAYILGLAQGRWISGDVGSICWIGSGDIAYLYHVSEDIYHIKSYLLLNFASLFCVNNQHRFSHYYNVSPNGVLHEVNLSNPCYIRIFVFAKRIETCDE